MIQEMNRAERRRLLQFVCSFAWADLEVNSAERQYVDRVIRMLELADDERAEVRRWLDSPPDPEAVDPGEVPFAHREIFVKAVEGMVAADQRFTDEERDQLIIFKQLMRNAEA